MQDQPRVDLRMLKAVVGILGVLIILGLALVIGTVIHRLYARTQPPSIPMAAPAGLAPGEHVAGIASAGPDVAIWVSGPAGDRVLLLDPATGRASVLLQGSK